MDDKGIRTHSDVLNFIEKFRKDSRLNQSDLCQELLNFALNQSMALQSILQYIQTEGICTCPPVDQCPCKVFLNLQELEDQGIIINDQNKDGTIVYGASICPSISSSPCAVAESTLIMHFTGDTPSDSFAFTSIDIEIRECAVDKNVTFVGKGDLVFSGKPAESAVITAALNIGSTCCSFSFTIESASYTISQIGCFACDTLKIESCQGGGV